MMCPNCKEIVDFKIDIPQEVEFISGYKFTVDCRELYRNKKFYYFTNSILNDFTDGKIGLSDFKEFVDKGFYGEFQLKGKCPECLYEVSKVDLVYYGVITYVYEELLEKLFLEAFKEKYHADGKFLIIRKDEIPKLSKLFFVRDEKYSTHLYNLLDIYHFIPFERGGDGGELLNFAVKDIALGLFGSFLYQMFFQDITDNLKARIKEKFKDIKKKSNQKEILRQLKKYMKNEHVEWNEENAIELVQAEIDNLIEKYIESLY